MYSSINAGNRVGYHKVGYKESRPDSTKKKPLSIYHSICSSPTAAVERERERERKRESAQGKDSKTNLTAFRTG